MAVLPEGVVGSIYYEMKGIPKKHAKRTRTEHSDDELINEYLLSASKEGGELSDSLVRKDLLLTDASQSLS